MLYEGVVSEGVMCEGVTCEGVMCEGVIAPVGGVLLPTCFGDLPD